MITAKQFTDITDFIVRMHLALVGTPQSGHGTGVGTCSIDDDHGASLVARHFESYVLHTHDWAIIETMGPTMHGIVAQTADFKLSRVLCGAAYEALIKACAKAGVSGHNCVEELLRYYNTGEGGCYAALVSPLFADLTEMLYPGTGIPPTCVYALPSTLGVIEAGGGVSGASPIDASRYAGAARAVAVVTSSSWHDRGNDRLIVFGSARGSDGEIFRDRKFGAAVSENGEYWLQPAEAGDLLIDVEDVRLPVRMAVGRIAVEARAPEDRTCDA